MDAIFITNWIFMLLITAAYGYTYWKEEWSLIWALPGRLIIISLVLFRMIALPFIGMVLVTADISLITKLLYAFLAAMITGMLAGLMIRLAKKLEPKQVTVKKLIWLVDSPAIITMTKMQRSDGDMDVDGELWKPRPRSFRTLDWLNSIINKPHQLQYGFRKTVEPKDYSGQGIPALALNDNPPDYMKRTGLPGSVGNRVVIFSEKPVRVVSAKDPLPYSVAPTCVLHNNRTAITAIAHIPVCSECDQAYHLEGQKYLPSQDRVFYNKLQNADAERRRKAREC